MGVTPNLVTGVWVGGEDRDIHFDNITLGQGANMALPIFGIYMQDTYADKNLNITDQDEFEKPLNFNLDLNCNDEHISADRESEGESDDDFVAPPSEIF